jgi:glycine/D-amino acid oxidase-like deaminating enzyme
LQSVVSADALVLGAGIVGVSVAVHLQKRGRSTVLVDRRGPAEETSFGNAGLVQREGVYPYGFPHDFGALFRYGLTSTRITTRRRFRSWRRFYGSTGITRDRRGTARSRISTRS